MSLSLRYDMPRIVVRCVAVWLSATALGVCAAFTWWQIQLADFFFLEWRIHTAWLLVVAFVAGTIALRPSVCSRRQATLVLAVGHVTAAISTYEFLRSRITCFFSESIDYLLPTDTGALLLFGPTLVALLAVTNWRGLRSFSAS
jgi:hypothetical protein